MKSKKLMAVALTATMVVGSSVTVLAEDANGATGTGTSFDHVNKKVTAVTLPTTAEVANVFDYYVDPERIINDAKSLADATAVTPNTDGVYFLNSGVTTGATEAVDASVDSYSIGGVTTGLTITIPNTTAANLKYDDGTGSADTPGWYEGTDTTTPVTVTIIKDSDSSTVTPSLNDTITVNAYQPANPGTSTSGYSSSSDAVSFEGRNSVDVDVTVTAAVDTTVTGADKNIALVADADALAAAKTPALLMKLKVGNTEKAITSSGASASAKVEGVADNFAVTAESGSFVYKIRTNLDEKQLDPWNETSVQLIGKTNIANVPTGAGAMTAPKINLTWTIAEHQDSALSAKTISKASNSVTVTGATVSGVKLVKANGTEVTLTTQYSFTNGTLAVNADMLGANVGGKIVMTLSTGTTEELTIQ